MPHSNHYNIIVTEGIDYIIQGDEECRTLKFEFSHEGRQTTCIYIEILDDDVIEPDEFFSVQLSSTDPAVTLARDRATIRIVDDDGDQVLPTENTNCPRSTSPPPGNGNRLNPTLYFMWLYHCYKKPRVFRKSTFNWRACPLFRDNAFIQSVLYLRPSLIQCGVLGGKLFSKSPN